MDNKTTGIMIRIVFIRIYYKALAIPANTIKRIYNTIPMHEITAPQIEYFLASSAAF